jgi:hypothetical protein
MNTIVPREGNPMLPEFLLTETTVREAGTGAAIALDEQQGGTLVLTLGITRIIEQESIDLSIWGSVDGNDWGTRPVATFPQKFYCGTYQIIADLSERSDVKFLRAKWAVNRWGKGSPQPLFTIYLFVQALQQELQPELAVGAA